MRAVSSLPGGVGRWWGPILSVGGVRAAAALVEPRWSSGGGLRAGDIWWRQAWLCMCDEGRVGQGRASVRVRAVVGVGRRVERRKAGAAVLAPAQLLQEGLT